MNLLSPHVTINLSAFVTVITVYSTVILQWPAIALAVIPLRSAIRRGLLRWIACSGPAMAFSHSPWLSMTKLNRLGAQKRR